MKTRRLNTLVIGSGASGLAAALRLKTLGVDDVLLLSEGLRNGTSINTGSDKQTYYKLGIYGAEPDSPALLGRTLFDGGSVHGDVALVEAAMSVRCFMNLVNLGVPFPCDEFGQYVGYKTDHDPKRRATSCGPYTSREMCLALIRAVKAAGVEIAEKRNVAELVTVDGRAAGAVAWNRETKEFETYLAENTVFAVGGPGGLYASSVYPAGHMGAIGLALKIGAKAQNLPESQFGLASTRFRWNVSGTYMQVLPRFVSTAADGVSDEREFLLDHYGDANAMNSMIFLKGYQWPFDVRKVPDGSSQIDLLVHEETVKKGRRVFLDFRTNTENLDFAALSAEAREYLEKSGACFGTPVERLEKMNLGAIELYRDHNIDLYKEKLEIAVCAQHNNGGLAGNIWYESVNVPHLFPIGEVNGSHGVTRPGGSALNAGQVGGFRAAEFIAAKYRENTLDFPRAEEAAKQLEADLLRRLSGTRDWRSDRREFQERMTAFAGHLRPQQKLDEAADAARNLLDAMDREGYPAADTDHAITNFHLAFSSWIYLESIAFQAASGAGSRGSAAVLRADNSVIPENPAFRAQVLGTTVTPQGVRVGWEPCRPFPETDGWFETVWAEFRTGKIYG
ncbi:FAD-binding protein [uncultured Victivallis sp.]|uniref:FAD-dependent oxidoreductase n=1 Tax=uncultured Victivallis sp. TaxID=354118 RepID=UPI0025CF26D1|nr:FAD-binding protein [uncultured Victivallis sp.]